MNYIGKKVSVAETNTLLCDSSELSNGIVVDYNEDLTLFRVEFDYRGGRYEYSMLPEELIFEDE